MYITENLKLISDCERCEYHKGIGKKYIRCEWPNGVLSLVMTFIANDIEGLTNGDGILYCQKDKKNEKKNNVS